MINQNKITGTMGQPMKDPCVAMVDKTLSSTVIDVYDQALKLRNEITDIHDFLFKNNLAKEPGCPLNSYVLPDKEYDGIAVFVESTNRILDDALVGNYGISEIKRLLGVK